MKKFTIVSLILFVFTISGNSTTVSMKISGPGAVNDSTITAGQKVFFDIYIENKGNYKGFTLGFKINSKDVKKAVHVVDKETKGLNSNGDVKGYNGFNDKSIWDLGGVYVVERDWDGVLPEVIGFGGVSKSKPYSPHKNEKKLSFEMIFDDAGSITIDSTYFKPTGKWMMAPPSTEPDWGGPYTFKIKK